MAAAGDRKRFPLWHALAAGALAASLFGVGYAHNKQACKTSEHTTPPSPGNPAARFRSWSCRIPFGSVKFSRKNSVNGEEYNLDFFGHVGFAHLELSTYGGELDIDAEANCDDNHTLPIEPCW